MRNGIAGADFVRLRELHAGISVKLVQTVRYTLSAKRIRPVAAEGQATIVGWNCADCLGGL